MNDNNIQVILWREHVRLRPAMHIGDMHFNGFLTMLSHLLTDIIDDTSCNAHIQFDFYGTDTVNIKVTNIVARKIGERLHQFSLVENHNAGSYGILILLSKMITIKANCQPLLIVLDSGVNKTDFSFTSSASFENMDYLDLSFTIDFELFSFGKMCYEHINPFLKKFAYLNPGLKITSIDNSDEYQKSVFKYTSGLSEKLDLLLAQKSYADPMFRLDLKTDINDYMYQVSFCYHHTWLTKTHIESYANNKETFLGGSLVDGVLAGIMFAVKEAASRNGVHISINKKKMCDNIVLLTAVKGNNLFFKGATREELDKPTIKKDIEKYVFEQSLLYLTSNPKEATWVLAKFNPNI